MPACGLEVGGIGPADGGPGGGDGALDGPHPDGLAGDGQAGDDGSGNDADCPRLCSTDGTKVIDCKGATVTVCEGGPCVQGACGATTWSPASLPGLVLWLRADSITGDAGTSIGTWADKSGQGHDATQLVGAKQPTLAPAWKNNQPAVSFSGGQYLLSTTTSLVAPNSAYSVLAVAQESAPAQGALFAVRATTPSSSSIWYVNGAVTFVHNGGQTVTVSGDKSATLEAPFWSVHRYTGAGATPRIFLNATELTASGAQTDETTGLAGFYVGNNAANQPWTGDIAEIVVVANAIADGDRAQWDAYAKARYGL